RSRSTMSLRGAERCGHPDKRPWSASAGSPRRCAARDDGGLTVTSDLAVAVDIGGTFTDVTLQASGQAWRAKVPSTPGDPSQAFMAGVEAVLAQAGVEASALGRVLHGTTVATNLMLEGKGARAALVTTRGLRQLMELRR